MLKRSLKDYKIVFGYSFLTFFSNRYILKSIQVRPELIVSEYSAFCRKIGLQII